MKVILSFSNLIDNIIKKIISIFLMIMTVVLFSQVIARYLMGTGLSWSEELVRYLCVWSVFLGATCAAKDGSQVSVTVLDEILKGTPKKILNVIQIIIAILFAILLTWIGYSTLEIAKVQLSPNMRISMGLIYSVIPISMIIMLVHLVAVIIKNNLATKEYQK